MAGDAKAPSMPVVPIDATPHDRPPASGGSSGIRSNLSTERLAALINSSPSLRGASGLTVPGSPAGSLVSPLGLGGGALARHHRSPRPSGSGGYSPRQRVILATLQEPAGQGPAGTSIEDLELGPSTATSPRSVTTTRQEEEDDEEEAKAAKTVPWAQYVSGTAPALSAALESRPVLDFANCTFRGFGQVMFMNNPISGAVIFLALLWQSLYVGTCGLIGAVSATATSQLLAVDAGARRSGLFTFNGVLVGLALATFDRGCTEAVDCALGHWSYFLGLLVPVVLFSAVSVIFSVSLGNMLAQVWGVAAFTLPFNFAALLFLGTALQSDTFPQQAFVPRLLPPAADVTTAAAAVEDIDWMLVLEAIPKGVGQVYLADNTVTGCVITVGLALCSPLSAIMAVLGSIIGIATALCMQVPLSAVYAGLWGYNAVLGTQAIGGMFFLPNAKAMALAVMCGVMCAYTGGLLSAVFAPTGLPTLTLPYDHQTAQPQQYE